MSKEIVKAIFDENIAGAREDLTFDAYFDSIKGNEEYKKGLFENYVSDGTKSYDEFNAETFGMGKPEAPSEIGGAEFSPTESVSSEFEVGPPAGGTPPGVEPKGAPVGDAIEPIEFGEGPNKEAPVLTRESLLDEFTIEDDMPKQTFWEKVVGFFTGDNVRPERVFVSQEHYDSLKARQDEELKRAEKEAAETGESLDIVDVIQDFVTVTPEEYVAFAGAIQRGLLEAGIAEKVKIGEIPTRADIIEIARIKKEQGQIPSSKNYEKFNDEKTSFLEALEIFAKDPLEIGGQIVLESGAALARYGWDRALLGGGLGAAGGSVVPGIGTAAGGGMGLVAGMGVSGFSLGHASDILSSFQDAGVDLTDKYSLESAFSNKETIAKARDFALKRNVPILLFDLFSGGIAGRIVKAPAKSVIGKVAKETAELGVQSGLAGAGEAAGQITAGQKFDPKSILSEMIGEVTTGVPEIAIGRAIDTKPSAHVAVGQMVEEKKAGKSVKAQAIKIDAPADVVKVMVDVSVGTGEIDAVQAGQIVQEYEQVQEVKKTIPEEFRNNEEIYSAIEEKKKLEEDKKTLDPVFTKGVDEKIAALDAKIEGIVSGREVVAADSVVAAEEVISPEGGGAPKVEIVAKRRQKLSRDRTKLVPTGGFDYFAKVGDREVKLSDAEYKAYKDSGVLPESVSAVEATPKVEGEAVTPEAVTPEVPALRDVESTAKALESKSIGKTKGRDIITDIQGLVLGINSTVRNIIKNTTPSKETLERLGLSEWNPKKQLADSISQLRNIVNSIPTTTRAKQLADEITGDEKAASYDILGEKITLLTAEIRKWYSGDTEKGSGLGVKEISEAYHKAKEDGSNPELVSAVEELLGKPTQAPEVAEGQPAEVISPEVAEVLSTEDTTRIALESLEVLPEGIESAEEGARIYHEAIGKEERTEAEDAVVMAVEDAVIGGAVVPEVAETPKAAEAVTPEEVSTEGVTPEVSGVVEAAEGQRQPSRVATFFSGAGTMEASLPNAQSVMAVEFNPAYVEAYNKAFGVEYEAKDVRDINPEEVIASKPDIFHASPVCKNFSAAKNKRTVLKSDMESADAVARVIREAQPPIVTIENVPDYQGTVPFETIVKALEDAGYTFDVGVYNSADFGGVQNRERLLIRAVKSGELPPIQEKTAPGDWYSAIEDLIESAPDSKFESRSESENWEMTRIKDMVRKGKLDPSKPIITMGGSASSGVAAAANAGGPAPTLLSTSRSVPRIILPDGTVKRVTPEMMRRLMGLPESYPIPSNPKIAKEVLGNGVDGAFTRALIDPLLNRAETQPSAETPTQPLTFKEKAKEAKQKADEAAEEIKRLLKGRNGGLGISPFGRAKRLAEIDRAVVVALASYVRNKVLAGAYTFKDFVKDMKENSKRMFGVEIRVTAQDELFFNQSASMYEIDDAFAGEIMELKNDFITAIAAMSGRINMNFEEFVASNQSLVDQFMDSAETNYGLNPAQAEALVKAMYQDALRAAANRNQLYQTEADIKNYQENAILGNRAFQDVSNSNKAVEVARRSNSISRLYDGFLRAFVTPTLSFDRVFRLAKDRLSLEREVYASRKSRMGASTKAANWYSDVQKKIFGGLSWGQLERLNEYIIAKRILDVEEKRNQDVAYSIKLNEELADPATTDDRKAEINEELAKLSNLGEIKHGSAMLNGKKVELTVDFAQGVIDANSGLDAKSIEIRERAEAYRKANDELLKMRLDAGLISQAAYDSMIKRDYVRRIFLDLSSSTIDAVDYPSISAKIKAIQEGSTDKSLEMDTQALLQLNAAATFDAVAKNKFIDKVAKWTENNQQAFLDRALEKFEKKFEKKNGKPLTDDEKQKFLKEQTLFEPIRNNQTPRSGFEKVTYFVDGVEKSMAVRSDLAAVFQTASGRGPVQNKQLISVMSKLNLTGLIKASAVFYNAAFALGNFALDVVHASMVTRDLYKSFSANLGVILAKALGITAENVYSKAVNYGGSLFGMAKRDSKFDRLVRDYFAHGGGMTFMSEIGSKMYTKRMAKSELGKAKSVAIDNASKIISVFNSIQSGSELITRVIIYEAALEKNIKEYKKQNGIDPTGADLTFIKESAAASAADLIDFREGSNTTKGLDQTFMPFLNAMVQGARAEIDFIAKNPIVAATRLAEFGGMALAVALYNAKSGEDDEKNGIIGYNGVSEYIRANYFVMMMPWTKKNEKGEVVRPYVSIKLPAMLKSINIFVEGTVSSRGYGEVTSQMAEAIKGGYVPEIGAASPTTQAVFALTANKDFFRKGAKVYRGKEKVLLPERFNMGETKKIYRDLFGAAYGLMNEEGEDKGVLGFNEAGPAQWQTAIEKAISSNNPYYLGITSGYANVSGLYGEKNQKEVDALYDDKLSALNSLAMRVYRTPQSSVQNSNSKKKEELKFLEKQIGSWQQRNTNTINGVVSKELREISESGKKKGFLLDRFFDEKIFNYISDAELTKEVKKAGIKKLPENLDDIQEFIKDEQSRMSIQLVEEFNPNFIFRHPALKEYNLAKNSYVGFNEDLILDIEKEYDNAKDGESYLIALKFVAGDDYDEIVTQIGVNPIEKMRVDNILKTPSAFQYKTAYFRRTNVSSNEVSSESAINNLILLKHLLENE